MSVFNFEQARELAEDAVFENEEVHKREIFRTYVVPFNGKFYQFSVTSTYDYGWEKSTFEEPFEVQSKDIVITRTIWEKV